MSKPLVELNDIKIMKLFVFPGNIEEDILSIGAQQLPYMRTSFFSNIVKESEQMILDLIGCQEGRVIPLTSSGTGAMDAVVTNYVSTKKKALVIAGGSFGYRWEALCKYYNIDHYTHSVEFGKDIDYSKLEEDIKREGVDVLLCQQHETSSGQLFNISLIGAICKANGVSLVVDAISSFLSEPLNMNDMGVDICLTSSQKGLNILPGIALIILSKNLEAHKFSNKSFYFDFQENLKNLTRGQTPYSPATSIFLQLHERLVRLTKAGLNATLDNVNGKALYFRGLCNKYGWKRPVDTPANCITGFFVNNNGDILFEELMSRGFCIMPGGTPNYFRVSHLGVQTEEDLTNLAKQIHEIETLNR